MSSKSQSNYEKIIVWYIIAYLLLVSSLSIQSDANFNFEWVYTVLQAGVISSLSFVFMSIFPQGSREVLVFFSKNKIPGKRIFSNIKNKKLKDIRINNDLALSKYCDIINEVTKLNGKEARNFENSKWYEIYNKHTEDYRVVKTHKDNLLGRDLFLTTLLLSMFTMIAFFVSLISFNWIVVIYLVLMLILTNIVARNNAARFVRTVIAVDLIAS